MKHWILGGAAALIAGTMVSSIWAQTPEAAAGPGATKAGASPPAASTVTEKTTKKSVNPPLVMDLESDFHAAHDAFDHGDTRVTAQDIRKAAALIRIEANRPNIPDQADLLVAAAELETLAGNVDQGSLTSPYDLSRAFSRVDLALARHYHLMSKEALQKHNTKQASMWLGVATECVNNSVAWNARELQESGSPVIKKMHQLQESLRQGIASGAHAAAQQTARGLDALGQDLQRLSQSISPYHGNSTSSPSP
jgi:hypothetical protein